MKYIFTEGQIKSILDNLISEERQINEQHQTNNKLSFATNNTTTEFDGEIKKDGYLYLTSEKKQYKIGPLSKIPEYGKSKIKIIKKNDSEKILFGKTPLLFTPDMIVKQIN
mgnify:CR=1 FL=1